VTQGPKIGQLALFFGANDMGSLMIEENVVASAGTVYYLSLEEIKRAIREAGWLPRQRNVFYQLIDRESDQRSAVSFQPETDQRTVVLQPDRAPTLLPINGN
jgi:cyclic dehypoxanthinyl futalosine synthase